jgi:uncharacterized membrane protein YkvA (DUF1232 family)
VASFGTIITWMVGLWVATKLIPPMIEGFNQGMAQKETRELIKQHPEHAVEIRRAAQVQQPKWEMPATAKKGGGAGKFVVMALCAAYIIFPLDFIPDFIPILGWGDDLAAGIIGLRALMK